MVVENAFNLTTWQAKAGEPVLQSESRTARITQRNTGLDKNWKYVSFPYVQTLFQFHSSVERKCRQTTYKSTSTSISLLQNCRKNTWGLWMLTSSMKSNASSYRKFNYTFFHNKYVSASTTSVFNPVTKSSPFFHCIDHHPFYCPSLQLNIIFVPSNSFLYLQYFASIPQIIFPL